jgi:hypothetical protein
MESISVRIKTWLSGHRILKSSTVDEVRSGNGFRVRDFPDLVVKVAHLSFFNSSLEMLFRGQDRDHKNSVGKSTLLPSIFRTQGYFTRAIAQSRFAALAKAESEIRKLAFKGCGQVRRHRVLQWAILQHYEICPTPLLDVTHSLRVACSFSKRAHEAGDTFLYVFGIPYLSGCIAPSGDQGIQALRLLIACPPRARRPHFQEGYLVGEYPELSLETTDNYNKDEWDFGRRLVCKLVLPPADQFWSVDYPPFPENALVPPNDPFEKQAQQVRDAIA